MTTTALQATIDTALALLQRVDRGDPAALFDCLVELEMLAADAVADYGVAALLRARGLQGHGASSPRADGLSTAA